MRSLWYLLVYSGVVAFIIYYPVLISVHVTLPLFIGFAGYLVLQGLDGRGWRYLLPALLYLINLEINLSLPLLLTLVAILIDYLFIYPHFVFIKHCRVCIAIVSVIFIDFIYLGLIEIYDFIFTSSSITLNNQLLYSLWMDIISAVIL